MAAEFFWVGIDMQSPLVAVSDNQAAGALLGHIWQRGVIHCVMYSVLPTEADIGANLTP